MKRGTLRRLAATECHYIPTTYSQNSYSAIKFVLLILIQGCTSTGSSSTEEKQFRPYGIQIFAHKPKTVETLARIPEGG